MLFRAFTKVEFSSVESDSRLLSTELNNVILYTTQVNTKLVRYWLTNLRIQVDFRAWSILNAVQSFTKVESPAV